MHAGWRPAPPRVGGVGSGLPPPRCPPEPGAGAEADVGASVAPHFTVVVAVRLREKGEESQAISP